MSEDMRQELSDVRTAVRGIEATVSGHARELSDLNRTARSIEATVSGHTRELGDLNRTVRSIAITVTGHTEAFSRVEKLLSKHDGALERIEKSLEAFTAEIIASRNERALMGKSFSDQQETLTDHELRLTRLEPREKPS